MAMSPLEIEGKVRQHENDLTEAYEMLAHIQGVQGRHTRRLGELGAALGIVTQGRRARDQGGRTRHQVDGSTPKSTGSTPRWTWSWSCCSRVRGAELVGTAQAPSDRRWTQLVQGREEPRRTPAQGGVVGGGSASMISAQPVSDSTSRSGVQKLRSSA